MTKIHVVHEHSGWLHCRICGKNLHPVVLWAWTLAQLFTVGALTAVLFDSLPFGLSDSQWAYLGFSMAFFARESVAWLFASWLAMAGIVNPSIFAELWPDPFLLQCVITAWVAGAVSTVILVASRQFVRRWPHVFDSARGRRCPTKPLKACIFGSTSNRPLTAYAIVQHEHRTLTWELSGLAEALSLAVLQRPLGVVVYAAGFDECRVTRIKNRRRLVGTEVSLTASRSLVGPLMLVFPGLRSVRVLKKAHKFSSRLRIGLRAASPAHEEFQIREYRDTGYEMEGLVLTSGPRGTVQPTVALRRNGLSYILEHAEAAVCPRSIGELLEEKRKRGWLYWISLGRQA